MLYRRPVCGKHLLAGYSGIRMGAPQASEDPHDVDRSAGTGCPSVFVLGETQQAIAERLQINRTKIHRLLAEAKERGIV